MNTTKRPAVKTTHVHVRWLIRRDILEVLAIERASFCDAWTEADFLACLRQRNVIGMVAEHGDKVIGYMLYDLHARKMNVLNFAVDPDYRRQTVGEQMAAKLVSKLASNRRNRITLTVRETNLPAQLFWREQGFKCVRVLRGHYDNSGEDAYVMAYKLADDACPTCGKSTATEGDE